MICGTSGADIREHDDRQLVVGESSHIAAESQIAILVPQHPMASYVTPYQAERVVRLCVFELPGTEQKRSQRWSTQCMSVEGRIPADKVFD